MISAVLFSFAPIMFAQPAHAVPVPASITCADSAGNINAWTVQWNNENQYFSDKGNIAAHFCEGGFAGGFTNFVSVVGANGAELEPSLLYFNGIIPEPELPSEPVQSTEDTTRVTEEVVRTEDVARTEEVVREPEPQPVPVEPVAPIEPEPTPEPQPEVEPTPEAPVSPVELTKPSEVISPTPEAVEPPTEPTEPEISPEPPVEPSREFSSPLGAVTEAIAAAVSQAIEAFQTAGLDMTEEERKTAQSVIVPSVIVAQIATLTFRK
jgi:hypothetical protein